MIKIGETHAVFASRCVKSADNFCIADEYSADATEAVKRLVEEMRQCRTDLMIAAGNADNAAKHDPRWEGVGAILRARVVMADAALAPFTDTEEGR